MRWVDITFLIILLILVAKGAWDGLVQQLFRYMSLAVGILVCFWAYPRLDSWYITRYPEGTPFWVVSLTLLLLFAVSIFIVFLCGKLITKLINPTPLAPIDRSLGALFGVVKTWILLLLLTIPLILLPLPPQWFKKTENSYALRFSLFCLQHWRDKWQKQPPFLGNFQYQYFESKESYP